MTVPQNLRQAELNVATAVSLVAESRALRSAATWIKVRARDARGARRLSGASDDDTSRIEGAIGNRTLCGSCIASKAAVLLSRVDDVLIRLGHPVPAHFTFGICEECRRATVVHHVGQS